MGFLLLIAILYQYLLLPHSTIVTGSAITLPFLIFLCTQANTSISFQRHFPLTMATHASTKYVPPPISCVYPASMGIFLSRCILLWHWFYNMTLRMHGISWPPFSESSHIFGTWPRIWDTHVSPRPLSPRHRPRHLHPERHHLLTFLTMMSTTLTQVQPFSLCSDLAFRQDLRAYRSAIGTLETSSMNTKDLQILQQQLRSTGHLF